MASKKETTKKPEKKQVKDRVVLALSTEQAKDLVDYLNLSMKDTNATITETIEKISKRIEATLNKQKVLMEFEKQGIKPSKEQIKKAIEVAK